MDIVTTSLDALLQRATNPQNENVDKAAVEAFCALVNKENEGSHIAVRLLANKIHASNEKEALQALGVLDVCMKKCGTSFNSEVGKFRFLNEMIKLVSPKYLGSQTAPTVRIKVLQLLQAWTDDHPRELKIKEAYDMLKKQGVVTEASQTQKITECAANRPSKTSNSIFDNDERSRLLQKLLQSKNPDDLQAANRLIKTMVKEDDKRAELVSRRVVELEAVHNNVRLLNEMLDSYRSGLSSSDELELIRELHQSCERLRPNVYRLAAETQQNEEMLKEVLQASDELSRVFDKYTAVIVKGVVSLRRAAVADEDSLLDLGGTSGDVPTSRSGNLLLPDSGPGSVSDMDALCDIFSSAALSAPLSLLNSAVLKPTSAAATAPTQVQLRATPQAEPEKTNSKLKALEDLDVLGETLLKENLSGGACRTNAAFNKNTEKIPMNLLSKHTVSETQPVSVAKNSVRSPAAGGDTISGLDLSFLTGELNKQSEQGEDLVDKSVPADTTNGDDCMVDITEDKSDSELCIRAASTTSVEPASPAHDAPRAEIRPLTDVSVKLESVKPSGVAPLTVLEERNGVSVTLHFARDKPRDDVQVVVVTTISKNGLPLTDYSFQAVVPKTCKLKLQPPSGSELPAHNPFLPPAAITQIMLIANPARRAVSLKFMVSYTMDDETCTEMGEVDNLPSV